MITEIIITNSDKPNNKFLFTALNNEIKEFLIIKNKTSNKTNIKSIFSNWYLLLSQNLYTVGPNKIDNKKKALNKNNNNLKYENKLFFIILILFLEKSLETS